MKENTQEKQNQSLPASDNSNAGKMSKKKKRCIIWTGVIIGILLVLLFLPGIIVQHVVPPIASKLLKVKVEIGSAYINIFDGAVRIRNMKIHNPAGYDAPYAFELGHFYVDVAMLTLTKPKIEIKDIIIENMHATMEMKWGTNNLADISNSLKKPEKDEKPANDEKKSDDKPKKETPKMVIRHFKIAQSDFTMLKVPWPIPSVELTDVGDGRPITDFVAVVYDAIAEAVISASKAVAEGAGNVGKGIGKAAESIGKSTRDASDAVVKSTGKAIEDVSKSLKNVFSK